MEVFYGFKDFHYKIGFVMMLNIRREQFTQTLFDEISLIISSYNENRGLMISIPCRCEVVI